MTALIAGITILVTGFIWLVMMMAKWHGWRETLIAWGFSIGITSVVLTATTLIVVGLQSLSSR